jgi:hypothetical protein
MDVILDRPHNQRGTADSLQSPDHVSVHPVANLFGLQKWRAVFGAENDVQ